jgi:hypothetical protein
MRDRRHPWQARQCRTTTRRGRRWVVLPVVDESVPGVTLVIKDVELPLDLFEVGQLRAQLRDVMASAAAEHDQTAPTAKHRKPQQRQVTA